MEASGHTESRSEGRPADFVFVIPVRNPHDRQVADYESIEALLESTVGSLLRQTHSNVAVVVVAHKTPDWAENYDGRLVFLNVSNERVFRPNQHHMIIDKGLRYTIGALYAMSRLNPKLIMMLDADDYVHVELAERLLSIHKEGDEADGYMIHDGVHLAVEMARNRKPHYKFAVVVNEFDFSCGSCRVFDAKRLNARIMGIDSEISRRFSRWDETDEKHTLKVPGDSIEWLERTTRENRDKKNHILHLIGRHVKQRGFFKFHPVDFVAAAKGCGHGNNGGPRKGAIHWFRFVRRMPLRKCLKSFGLPPQRWSFDYLAMVRARSADMNSENMWPDKYMKNREKAPINTRTEA